jgi:hypothetical protein
MRLLRTLFWVASLSAGAWADKIIMKDGKIYEGHIMGETSRSVLISNPPLDPKPRFIELKDVLTLVRESHKEMRSAESDRAAVVEIGLAGNVFSSRDMPLDTAPGLHVGGGFRVHPLLELMGNFDWIPALSGELVITDGTTTRSYESFYAYGGGFSAKVFPFFKRRDWRTEPYVTGGYRWNRLTPKASGDYLKGTTLEGGLGFLRPLRGHWYWGARFLYQYVSYDSVQFILRQGDLNSNIVVHTYSLGTELTYRFL